MDGIAAGLKNKLQLMIYRKNNILFLTFSRHSISVDCIISCTSFGYGPDCAKWFLSGSNAGDLYHVLNSLVNVYGNHQFPSVFHYLIRYRQSSLVMFLAIDYFFFETKEV